MVLLAISKHNMKPMFPDCVLMMLLYAVWDAVILYINTAVIQFLAEDNHSDAHEYITLSVV